MATSKLYYSPLKEVDIKTDAKVKDLFKVNLKQILNLIGVPA